MKLRALLAAVLACVCVGAMAQEGPATHLMRYADVHGDKVVFTYEGDLWLAPSAGGDARRITSDPGEERYAKFSPDGKWIAFTGSYDGGTDVYVMPAGGGVPVRLTYHPSRDLVLGWFPDGESVLFRTRRDVGTRGEEVFKVSVKGGMEQKLPVDRAGLTALSPDGKRIAYNRISRETATWKRHEGGDAQDIWMGSLDKGDYRRITDWKGTDNYPMWDGDFIYFTSDREAGTLNVFKYDVRSGETKAVTRYTDYDVKYPSLGDHKIVYQYGEELYVLDLKTEQSRKADVRIASDRVPVRADWLDASEVTGVFGLSPDGEKLVLESRGEILVYPADKEQGPGWNLTRSSGSRDKDPAWSPDGKRVAFLSDKTGEEELYLADPKGLKPWKQLTSGGKGYRFRPAWSPDSKYLLFGDKFMRLNLVDAATGAITVVDTSDYDDGWERWGIQDYTFSPDSKWVAYTVKLANTYEKIRLYNVETKQRADVTSGWHQSWSPSFDPKGRYLYFLSNRTFKPVMGTIDQTHVFLNMTLPYVVVLKAGEPSPFAPEEETAKDKDEGESGGGGEKSKGKEPSKPAAKATAIDLEGLEARTVPAKGVEPGAYFCLQATPKGFLFVARTETVFSKYDVITDFTEEKVDLKAYDLEEKEASDFLAGINSYHLSADGKKLAYRAGGKFGVVDAGGKAKVGDGTVDLASVKLKVDRMAEFRQIFDEAWRVQRDWYYDKNMQGNDWAAIGEMYRRFVGDCGNRSDLNYLIGEMIAELNTGHTYVYGGDTGDGGKRVGVGMLGCDFDTPEGSAFHRISHIIPGKAWDEDLRSPLAEPGCPVKEGDYLIAIDGQEVSAKDNLYKFLEDKAGKLVTLTFNSKPTAEGAKTCRVKALRQEISIRYQEWIDGRMAYVDKASGGTVGYIHLPDMGEDGLIGFGKAFYPQLDKRALLIDVRNNGGGFTSGMIINHLEKRAWAVTQPREGKACYNPEAVFYGPVAVTLDEDTGSDGEMFSEAIKIKGLARLFGMRSWGGAFGIEPHQTLADGGTVTPPQYGLYGLNGKWLIEGRGVDPDVVVENMPADVLKGKDAQLDVAVAYLLQEMKKFPPEPPGPPPYPDKSKPRGSDISGK